MRVYNENKTEALANWNLEEGYLKEDKLFKAHHDAEPGTAAITVEDKIAEIEASGGKVIKTKDKVYRVIKEYPSGGKDVEEITETPAVPAKEEYDEYEDIQVYIPYTEAELAERKRAEIRLRRETECFAVINRGKLWYDRLSVVQEVQLTDWYDAWLDAPETLVVPERPSWIDSKIESEEV